METRDELVAGRDYAWSAAIVFSAMILVALILIAALAGCRTLGERERDEKAHQDLKSQIAVP